MRKYTSTLLMVVALGFAGLATIGCSDDNDGPVEKAGQKVDQAVDSAKDAFDDDGPAENAGEKVDDAFDDDN